MNSQLPTWLTLETAAQHCDTSVASLRRWIKRGLLPAKKLPSGTWRVKREDLDAFIEGSNREPVQATD